MPPDTEQFLAPGAPAGVVRLASTGLAASLERFDDPGLLEDGKVNVISLDAILDRLGPRWPQRRDQVYDHAEKTLEKHLGFRGYFARVSETDYLICQPELGRFSAQAACLRYLREVFQYFLGDAKPADNCVHQVIKVSREGVTAAKVDARHVEREEEVEQAEHRQAVLDAEELASKSVTMDQWSPFVASDGRELRVTCSLEPVLELKTFGRIGFRMARRVLVVASGEALPAASVANLSSADILKIDLATIARGLDRVKASQEDGPQLSLIVPVSHVSLSSQRARAQIVVALKTAGGMVKRGVICEISDIEGVPQGALLSAASLIRPFSLFVVGRLNVAPPTSSTLAQLKGAGLQALSVECPHRQSEADFMDWAKATIDTAKQVAKSVLIYQASSSRDAGLAGLLGATHASVRG
ncbi:hypothetical protein [Phenylobacterium sp.]|jgi:hypothetical protein|uniref:hypothetical protein n=1 Tax=Phenylobacterium sp. TaxID=1871053 RepID=UPI002F3E25FD